MAYRHQLSDPSMARLPSVVYVNDDSMSDNMAVIQDFRYELEMKNHQIEALGERVKMLEKLLSSCSATTSATPPSRKTSLGLPSPSAPRCKKPTCPSPFKETQASEPPSLPSMTITHKRPTSLSSERVARVLENVYVPPKVVPTQGHDRTNFRSTFPTLAISKDSMYLEAYEMLQAMTIAEEADIKATFEPINKILPRERELDRRRKSPSSPAA